MKSLKNEFLYIVLAILVMLGIGALNGAKALPCEASRSAFIDAISNDGPNGINRNTVNGNTSDTTVTTSTPVGPNLLQRGAGQVLFTIPGDDGSLVDAKVTISTNTFNNTDILANFTLGPGTSTGSGESLTFTANCAERFFSSTIIPGGGDPVPVNLASQSFVDQNDQVVVIPNDGNTSYIFDLRTESLGGSSNTSFIAEFTGKFRRGQTYEATCGSIQEKGDPIDAFSCNVNVELVGSGGETPPVEEPNRFNGTDINFVQKKGAGAIKTPEKTTIDLVKDEDDGSYPFRILGRGITIEDENGNPVAVPAALKQVFSPIFANRGSVIFRNNLERPVDILFQVRPGVIRALFDANIFEGKITQEFKIDSLAGGANRQARRGRGRNRPKIGSGTFNVVLNFNIPDATLNCFTGHPVRITNLDLDATQGRSMTINGLLYSDIDPAKFFEPSDGPHSFDSALLSTPGSELIAAGLVRRGRGFVPAEEFIASLQDQDSNLTNLINIRADIDDQLTVTNGTLDPVDDTGRINIEILEKLRTFVDTEMNVGDKVVLLLNLDTLDNEFDTYLTDPFACTAGGATFSAASFEPAFTDSSLLPLVVVEKVATPRSRRAIVSINDSNTINLSSANDASNPLSVPISLDNISNLVTSNTNTVDIVLRIRESRRNRGAVTFDNGSRAIRVTANLRDDNGVTIVDPVNVNLQVTDRGKALIDRGRNLSFAISSSASPARRVRGSRVSGRALD